MSENNSNDQELGLRELLNETLLRDLILFILLYLFILAQGWDNFLLLLFPIISFSFAIFFRVIGTNKTRVLNKKNLVFYNPLGVENKNADRLVFVALFQLILLFWIGAESIYHPQLTDDFSLYFNIAYFLIFSFGFLWIFLGIWDYCQIIIDLSEFEKRGLEYKKVVISELSLGKIKIISYLNIAIFLTLSLLHILLILINLIDIRIGFFGNLPGTGIEDSEPLYFPITVLLIIIIFPLLAVIFLHVIYKEINSFSEIEFNTKVSSLPMDIKNQVMENLKTINKKFLDENFNI
jgi:hypothetical protein